MSKHQKTPNDLILERIYGLTITPEMISAGVEVVAEEYGVCGPDIAPDLARDVFKAMWFQYELKRIVDAQPLLPNTEKKENG